MRVALRFWPVLALGPGQRYGLWLQGCSRRCPSCMAQSFQPPSSPDCEELAPRELLADIVARRPEGVTISGGEPFEQPEELKSLLLLLRAAGIMDIIIYSGFSGECLLELCPWLPRLASCLIDGPFVDSLPTEAGWKGSGNQRAWIFRYFPAYADWLAAPKGRLQPARQGQNLYLLGIPRMGDAARLLGRNHGQNQTLPGLRLCQPGH